MTIILRIIEVVLGLLALATISIVVFLRRPDWSPFQEQTFGSNVIPVATMVAAWTTLLVAYAAFRTIRSNREKEERDGKERLLNEIRDWIFNIKDITLEPITEANMAFRQYNIQLKYGIPLNRVQLLEIEIKQILKNQDLGSKVSEVSKLLVAVMVLDKAMCESGNINENVIEAFPGYVNFIKEILSVIDDEANKTGKSKEVVAYDMWKKYTKELNNAEADVLNKIVSMKSDLFKS